jgi:hypothetical protein
VQSPIKDRAHIEIEGGGGGICNRAAGCCTPFACVRGCARFPKLSCSPHDVQAQTDGVDGAATSGAIPRQPANSVDLNPLCW